MNFWVIKLEEKKKTLIEKNLSKVTAAAEGGGGQVGFKLAAITLETAQIKKKDNYGLHKIIGNNYRPIKGITV